MIRTIVGTAVVVASLTLITPGYAAPQPCETGSTTGGCKTVDDPTKQNPKFVETQRGNVDAGGTEDTCSGANDGQTNKVC